MGGYFLILLLSPDLAVAVYPLTASQSRSRPAIHLAGLCLAMNACYMIWDSLVVTYLP